jgi:hypothetical protein
MSGSFFSDIDAEFRRTNDVLSSDERVSIGLTYFRPIFSIIATPSHIADARTPKALKTSMPKEEKNNMSCHVEVTLPSFKGADDATPRTLIAPAITLHKNKIIGRRVTFSIRQFHHF